MATVVAEVDMSYPRCMMREHHALCDLHICERPLRSLPVLPAMAMREPQSAGRATSTDPSHSFYIHPDPESVRTKLTNQPHSLECLREDIKSMKLIRIFNTDRLQLQLYLSWNFAIKSFSGYYNTYD